MTNRQKLSEAQRKILRAIADQGEAPYWSISPTHRSLIKRGLIERCDRVMQHGQQVSFTTHLCRLTDAGRARLAEGE